PAPTRRDGSRTEHVLAAANGPKQDLIVKRLIQKLSRAEPAGLISKPRIAIRGDEDDRHRRLLGYQSRLELDAGHSGHVEVSDQARSLTLLTRAQEFLSRSKGARLQARGPQQPNHRVAHRLVVVHHRDQVSAELSAGHAGSSTIVVENPTV